MAGEWFWMQGLMMVIMNKSILKHNKRVITGRPKLRRYALQLGAAVDITPGGLLRRQSINKNYLISYKRKPQKQFIVFYRKSPQHNHDDMLQHPLLEINFAGY